MTPECSVYRLFRSPRYVHPVARSEDDLAFSVAIQVVEIQAIERDIATQRRRLPDRGSAHWVHGLNDLAMESHPGELLVDVSPQVSVE